MVILELPTFNGQSLLPSNL